MLSTKLKEAAGNSADATLYVDDVFSTYLYTGNGATQTITNGIDLAGKGGLVWLKKRSAAESHFQFDTARGSNYALFSDSTSAQDTGYSPYFSFGSSGFNLTGSLVANNNAATYASWTFRKAAKFFDVVTYTGTGSARTIAHSLGVAPGMIIVKQTNSAGAWAVYHRGAAASGQTAAGSTLYLNTTAAVGAATTYWNNTAPTDSVFSVGTNGTTNGAGQTYVAYLFAHDTAADGIIQCGSFTSAPGIESVTLGWEPQWLLYKRADPTAGGWTIVDSMRGVPTGSASVSLSPNTSAAETAGPNITFSATGFSMDVGSTGDVWIYVAIRRPNKPPTTGTQVFSPNLSAATTGTPITTGFPLDLQIQQYTGFPDSNFLDRLRGVSSTSTVSGPYIRSTTTAAEVSPGSTTLNVNNTGFQICAGFSGASTSYLNFKRAPGFFDVVCYTGTGVARTVAHNLTVAPEMMIVKSRSLASGWRIYSPAGNASKALDFTSGALADNSTYLNGVSPTSSVFTVGGAGGGTNNSAETYVAYLFATLAGISKVGSYTGNGTTQAINCGFTAGARFFLVKATSTTGSWWVWDSARGITAGNDPALQLNSTAAEITTADAVDPYSPGITVNQEATCSINASGVSYIFLAVA